MSSDASTTLTTTSSWNDSPTKTEAGTLAIVICWSIEEPERVGEIALIEAKCVLGRGSSDPRDNAPRLNFCRRRPQGTEIQPPLGGTRISRLQLEIAPIADGTRLYVRSVGRCPMTVRGDEVDHAMLELGDTLILKRSMVLMVLRVQPFPPPHSDSWQQTSFPFGKPDAFGITGESPVIWALREQLAFAAQSGQHILLLGQSGTGKELAARAIHGLSSRRTKRFVARNAATFPEGLVDAELFGTAKGYPNAGSPERTGIIADADGGTLFLDEIGELPPHLQAHLLRVLDRDGEFQRLGESRLRRADLRVIAATNRPIEQIKHDFAARFAFRIQLPTLERRREDIPLLIMHLLTSLVQSTPTVERFFESHQGQRGAPRVDCALVEMLVCHPYLQHVRELERYLWVAMASSPGNFLALTPEVREASGASRQNAPPNPTTSGQAGEMDPQQIEAALTDANGNITEAAQKLGLKNRFALYRLMKKFGIVTPGNDEKES